jgi:hypothetical protein
MRLHVQLTHFKYLVTYNMNRVINLSIPSDIITASDVSESHVFITTKLLEYFEVHMIYVIL